MEVSITKVDNNMVTPYCSLLTHTLLLPTRHLCYRNISQINFLFYFLQVYLLLQSGPALLLSVYFALYKHTRLHAKWSVELQPVLQMQKQLDIINMHKIFSLFNFQSSKFFSNLSISIK